MTVTRTLENSYGRSGCDRSRRQPPKTVAIGHCRGGPQPLRYGLVISLVFGILVITILTLVIPLLYCVPRFRQMKATVEVKP